MKGLNINYEFTSLEDRPLFPKPPTYIIVHHTGSSAPDENMMRYLRTSINGYHYIIGQDGQIYQSIPPSKIAYHAGESSWGLKGQKTIKVSFEDGRSVLRGGMNPFSIGVSLNSDGKNFTNKQKASTFNFLVKLCLELNISPYDILRHSDITQFDERKAKSRILLPYRSDSKIAKECRKPDVGCNLWNNWLTWTWENYQEKIQKEVEKYKKL